MIGKSPNQNEKRSSAERFFFCAPRFGGYNDLYYICKQKQYLLQKQSIMSFNNPIRGGGDSESINLLRFPLAIFVVFIHGFGAEIDVAQLHASGLSGVAIYNYVRIFCSTVIAHSAVPIFFIISGYLLFLKVEQYNRKTYEDKLRKRWHSLLKPYLAWNILKVLWTLMFIVGGILLYGKPWSGIADYFRDNGYLHLLWDCNVWGERTTWLGVMIHASGPVLFPFWYMRDLMMMVLLSPLVWWLVKKLRLFYLVILLAIYAFDIRVSWISITFAQAALFFSIGAYFAIMKQDFTQVLWKGRYVICPLAVVLMCWQTYTGSMMGDEISRMIHPWLVVVQSFALIIVASALCRYRRLYEKCKQLAPASFFVYASHVFILWIVTSLVNKIVPMSDTWYMQTLCYLVSPLLCTAICVGVYFAMRRFLPRVTSVLMGERKR